MEVDRLYLAIVGNQPDVAASLVTEDAMVAFPGVSGTIEEVIKRLHDGAELRTWSDDSADVLTSEWHGVVLDRWLKGDLDQHVTFLAAAKAEDGRYGLVSLYGFDNDGIARFFG